MKRTTDIARQAALSSLVDLLECDIEKEIYQVSIDS